jgi:hypothetical protein
MRVYGKFHDDLVIKAVEDAPDIVDLLSDPISFTCRMDTYLMTHRPGSDAKVPSRNCSQLALDSCTATTVQPPADQPAAWKI